MKRIMDSAGQCSVRAAIDEDFRKAVLDCVPARVHADMSSPLRSV